MPTPNQPDYSAQIEELNTQVANLQNLVNALQNQQSNPSTNIPQTSGSSKTTTIPPVTSVQILGTKVGPRGVAVTVGFNTPQGVLSGQIDHYNIWLKTGIANPTGQGAPIVVASSQTSPCTFTYTAPSTSITGIVGVQTVMKDGQVLAFNLCPTTALTLSPASAVVTVQFVSGVSLPLNTFTNVGNSITVATAGTYLLLLEMQITSTSASQTTQFTINKNGVGQGNNQTIFADASRHALGMYSLVLAAGDVLQPSVNSVTGAQTYNINIQMALLKQFSS